MTARDTKPNAGGARISDLVEAKFDGSKPEEFNDFCREMRGAFKLLGIPPDKQALLLLLSMAAWARY